jgi:hypothetical protein
MKEEKLRVVEFRQRSMTEEEVHLCEPEKGLFLDEDMVNMLRRDQLRVS